MTATTPVPLDTMTDRELYRLAFDISEELVARECGRLRERLMQVPSQADGARAVLAAEERRVYALDPATNYGAW